MIFKLVLVYCLLLVFTVHSQDIETKDGEKLLPQECGQVKPDSTNHPWTVLLEYNNVRTSKKTYACLGSVINKKYVVTAATCISGSSSITLTGVVVPKPNTAIPDQGTRLNHTDVISIEESIVHPEYRPNGKDVSNDIGLLRLAKELSLTGDYPRPLCLPRNGAVSSIPAGERATAWSRNSADFQVESGFKFRELHLPVVSNADCNEVYGKLGRPVVESQLCAGGVKGEDTCKGDTGGSLVVTRQDRNYLLGIVSFGANPCGRENWPAVYTRVEHFVPWILQNMKE